MNAEQYTPEVGDTVRITEHGVSEYVVRLPADVSGKCVLEADGNVWLESYASVLVKVEKPADRYVIVSESGHVFPHSAESVASVEHLAMVKGDRVARFTFAEWVDQ